MYLTDAVMQDSRKCKSSQRALIAQAQVKYSNTSKETYSLEFTQKVHEISNTKNVMNIVILQDPWKEVLALLGMVNRFEAQAYRILLCNSCYGKIFLYLSCKSSGHDSYRCRRVHRKLGPSCTLQEV